MNAQIVQAALKRKGMVKDRMLGREPDGADPAKRKKGTLL